MNVRVLHDSVGTFAKGTIVPSSAYGTDVDRLMAIGAVEETDSPPTERFVAAGLPPDEASPLKVVADLAEKLAVTEACVKRIEETVAALRRDLNDDIASRAQKPKPRN